LTIVKHLDVLEDSRTGLGSCGEVGVVDQLLFERDVILHHSEYALFHCFLRFFCSVRAFG